MFTEPQSVTINGVASSLPKTFVDGSSSRYTSADGNLTLSVQHTRQGGKIRSVIRLDQRKVAADPLLAERNVPTEQSVWMVHNAPTNGLFTVAERKFLIDALMGNLQASTGANTTKFIGGES